MAHGGTDQQRREKDGQVGTIASFRYADCKVTHPSNPEVTLLNAQYEIVSVSLSVLAPGVGIVDNRTVLLEVDASPRQPRAGTGPSFFAYLMALCVQEPPDHNCTGPCDGLPMMLTSIDWCCENPSWGQAGCSGCVCRVRLVWVSWARDTLPGNTASKRVSKDRPQGPARSPLLARPTTKPHLLKRLSLAR